MKQQKTVKVSKNADAQSAASSAQAERSQGFQTIIIMLLKRKQINMYRQNPVRRSR